MDRTREDKILQGEKSQMKKNAGPVESLSFEQYTQDTAVRLSAD